MIKTIDGAAFSRMMLSAAAEIDLNKQKVNELNVFPVPDGDTGTNMSMTLSAASTELRKADGITLTKAADKTASALLRGARGNSGVILSLLFRGFSKALKGKLGADGRDFAAALTAADAVLKSITPHGEQDKPVGEYLQSDCKRLIEYVVVDKDRTGSVKRFGNTSSSHATLIAAESGGIYALSVQGSGLIYGTTPDIAEQVTYVDDLTGSAAYKKYLAGIVFTLGR